MQSNNLLISVAGKSWHHLRLPVRHTSSEKHQKHQSQQSNNVSTMPIHNFLVHWWWNKYVDCLRRKKNHQNLPTFYLTQDFHSQVLVSIQWEWTHSAWSWIVIHPNHQLSHLHSHQPLNHLSLLTNIHHQTSIRHLARWRTDMLVNSAGRSFPDLPISRDIWEHIQENNPINVNTVKEASPYHPTSNATCETSTIKKNLSAVLSVTAASVNKRT